MKITFTFSSILLLVFILACSNTEEQKPTIPPTQKNPNGDSELALLMRDMFDDGMRMKKQIENGEAVEILNTFEKIHSAKATEPEKAASQPYKIYADSYLQVLERLKNASKENAPAVFHELVGSCMTCHQAMCPGPMVRIKHLYLAGVKK